MQNYHWPGNVRELRNLAERAVILCTGEEVEVKHLPRHIFQSQSQESGESVQLGKPLHEIEREIIFKTLEQTGNNKTKAARILGISLKTMHNKLNKYLSEEK